MSHKLFKFEMITLVADRILNISNNPNNHLIMKRGTLLVSSHEYIQVDIIHNKVVCVVVTCWNGLFK